MEAAFTVAALCVVGFFVGAIVMLGVGVSTKVYFTDVACTLLNATGCTPLCHDVEDYVDYGYNGGQKRDTYTVCQGAVFSCDVQYTYGNETLISRGLSAAWDDARFNCSDAAANNSAVVTVLTYFPGNVTGVHPPGYATSESTLIVGAVAIALFLFAFCLGVIRGSDRCRNMS